MKHTLALVLMVFGLVGCASQFYAQTNVYINPLFNKDEKLSYAVRINDVKAAKRFLEAGANPNNDEVMCFVPFLEFEESQCSPPMMAAFLNMDIEMIDLLVNAGGNVNYKFPNSDSLLTFAVSENNIEVVLRLLENGTNPNYKNVNGVNALTVAVQTDNPQMAQLLLSYGVNPDKYFWSEVLHFKSSNEFIRSAWKGINKGSAIGNIIIGNQVLPSFSDEGIVLSVNGDRYEGGLKKSQMHGKGKFILANGYIYEGNFVQGKLYNGQINTGGKIAKIANGKATLTKAEKLSLQKDMNRLKVEGNKNYKRAMTSSNNSQVVEDIATIGVGIVALAIMLPLMVIEEILSGDVLHEVAKDLPAAYFENKRQQQVIRNAYVRGANSQRKFFPTQTQPRQPVRNLNNRKPCTPGFC